MAHPIWKGHISFGLVFIPIELYAAEKRSDLHFKLLDSRNHGKIHYERINEATGEEVPWNEVVKGYEYDKNHYVVLNDEDFKQAAPETSQAIEIEAFVDEKSIAYLYFDKPYYIVPQKKSEKGYVLLREILHRSKKVGIAKVVIRTRQYLTALYAADDALVLNLLRFPQELRDAKEFDLPSGNIKAYKITPKELTMAEQLINAMTTTWNPKAYHDDYREALLEWIKKKEKGVKPKALPKAKPGAKVIDFMQLLQKSIAEKKAKEKNNHAKKHAHSKKRGKH